MWEWKITADISSLSQWGDCQTAGYPVMFLLLGLILKQETQYWRTASWAGYMGKQRVLISAENLTGPFSFGTFCFTVQFVDGHWCHYESRQNFVYKVQHARTCIIISRAWKQCLQNNILLWWPTGAKHEPQSLQNHNNQYYSETQQPILKCTNWLWNTAIDNWILS